MTITKLTIATALLSGFAATAFPQQSSDHSSDAPAAAMRSS
ncbi:hypothetical protein [Mesorhizobium sp.]|nr:hypothetical protein [Mesorhizobium sp.]